MAESLSATKSERELWQEVLLLAVDEALHGPKHVLDKKQKLHMCRSARAYITTPSRDLSMVCAFAGLDMQAVIERMRVQIANAPAVEDVVSSARR